MQAIYIQIVALDHTGAHITSVTDIQQHLATDDYDKYQNACRMSEQLIRELIRKANAVNSGRQRGQGEQPTPPVSG